VNIGVIYVIYPLLIPFSGKSLDYFTRNFMMLTLISVQLLELEIIYLLGESIWITQ